MAEHKNKGAANEPMPDSDEQEILDDSSPEIETDEELDGTAEESVEVGEESKLETRVQELQDKLLRTAAEFENYRKRVARQYDEMVQSANDRILLDFVEIADNLQRALEHAEKDANGESLRQGVQLIHSQMMGLFERYNVKPIDALGKPFDPNLHDALMQVESDEYDEGVVAIEISKGYSRGEKILRHSKVGVSKGKN